MAGHMSIRSSLNDAGTIVTLQIDERGKPLAHITLEEPEFTALLHSLTKLRAKMTDPIPLTLEPGARLDAFLSPRTFVGKGHSKQRRETVLALRHPGLGWVAGSFEPDGLKQLAEALLAHLPPE